MGRLTKFTLELEGSDEELRRILSAVWTEWARVNHDASPPITFFAGGPVPMMHYAPSLATLRGTITYKEAIPE